MSSPALTHHEILELVEPFTRSGRALDLAASDRIERRLVFRPIEHVGETSAAPGVCETLQLDSPGRGEYLLTRCFTRPCGLQARLQTRGAQAAALLGRVEAYAPTSLFRAGPGFLVAHSLSLEADGSAGVAGREAVRTVLKQSQARVGGLLVVMALSGARGYPAEIKVTAARPDAIRLPEDLLAVLGWGWARLYRAGAGWTSGLRLRKHEPERSEQAQGDFERAVAHLAQTLSEPPARFHERLRRARWTVFFRRSIPLLTVLGLVAAAMSVPYLGVDQDSVLRMLILNAPPLLLAFGVCLKEMPRFEIPPVPRATQAAAWWRGGEPQTPPAAGLPSG